MIGPFCYKNISTNEEMKKNLQKQNIIYICLIILGIITFIISFFTKDYMKDFMLSLIHIYTILNHHFTTFGTFI